MRARSAVGKNQAGERVAFGNPIQPVLDKLNVDFKIK
jgi:hypothetical protein